MKKDRWQKLQDGADAIVNKQKDASLHKMIERYLDQVLRDFPSDSSHDAEGRAVNSMAAVLRDSLKYATFWGPIDLPDIHIDVPAVNLEGLRDAVKIDFPKNDDLADLFKDDGRCIACGRPKP